MAHVQMTEHEARSQQVFNALMWALSYPGRVQPLPGSGPQPFLNIGETLIDLETSYYTPQAELQSQLAELGARSKSPELASYQFYPELNERSLEIVRNAPIGSYLSPDDSATLIIGAEIGSGYPLLLSGPGIQTETTLLINGIPPAFWELRKEMRRYPAGWDIFLVGNDQLVGLPRTTDVEVLAWRM